VWKTNTMQLSKEHESQILTRLERIITTQERNKDDTTSFIPLSTTTLITTTGSGGRIPQCPYWIGLQTTIKAIKKKLVYMVLICRHNTISKPMMDALIKNIQMHKIQYCMLNITPFILGGKLLNGGGGGAAGGGKSSNNTKKRIITTTCVCIGLGRPTDEKDPLSSVVKFIEMKMIKDVQI
jgi:hypothetical protein